MTLYSSPTILYLRPFTLFFILLGIADIVCNVSLAPKWWPWLATVGHFIKPSLMPCLAIWVYMAWQNRPIRSLRLLLAALLFSAVGDTLLMLAIENRQSFFLLGLCSFLMAHICYILLHSRLLKGRPLSEWFILRHKWIWVVALLYGAGLLYVLRNFLWLHGLLLPVAVYALVLLSMALSALNRKGAVLLESFHWVFWGALSFVVSDSMIALNRFGMPFYSAGFWIMVTYLLAQYSIVRGVLIGEVLKEQF